MDLFAMGWLEASTREAEASAQQALHSADHSEAELRRLEICFAKLSQLTAGMWELVKDKIGVTDDELQEVMNKIAAQRQQEQQQRVCPQCGRAMSMRDRHCLYCEYTLPDTDPFSSVSTQTPIK